MWKTIYCLFTFAVISTIFCVSCRTAISSLPADAVSETASELGLRGPVVSRGAGDEGVRLVEGRLGRELDALDDWSVFLPYDCESPLELGVLCGGDAVLRRELTAALKARGAEVRQLGSVVAYAIGTLSGDTSPNAAVSGDTSTSFDRATPPPATPRNGASKVAISSAALLDALCKSLTSAD